MADRKKYINWILEEIPDLTEKGIITKDNAAALNAYYNSNLAALPPPKNIYSLVIGIIGIVMAVAGIILFLNYNWDMFPKVVRIGLAAFPLLIGAAISYYTFFRNKGQSWREASAILTSAGAGTLIAVLSQIYHTGGELHEFMFLLSLLSLPLIYIFNSIGLATLYLFFSFFVLGWNVVPWWNALLIALVLPYLFFHLRKNSKFCIWCRCLAIVPGISLFIGPSSKGYESFTAILLCSIFLVGGADLLRSNNTSFGKNPWLIPAFILQTILLAIGSSTSNFFRCDLSEKTEATLWTFVIVSVLLFLGYMVLFFRKHINFEKIAALLLIILTAIPMIYVNNKQLVSGNEMRIFYSIYMGIYGIALIYYGIKQSSLLIFNGGAVTIVLLTACRFFDSDIGLLTRSIALMVLGIGFLLSNWIFVKFNREAGK